MRFGKSMVFVALLLAGAASFAKAQSVHSDETAVDPFEPFLSDNAPKCVPLEQVAAVSKLVQLNNDQFQFARALYAAIPPLSDHLPPGDKAMVATAGDKAMVVIVGDDQVCARFAAPNQVLNLLKEVEQGAPKVGDPT